jgi:hypothetical protein
MILIEMVASIVFALLSSSLAVYLLRRRGYQIAYFWLFIFMLLATWAGGIWIRPVGPDIGGLFIVPFIMAGVLAICFLMAFVRPPGPHGRRETIYMLERIQRQREIKKITTISLNIFFYCLLVLLVVAIIWRHGSDVRG